MRFQPSLFSKAICILSLLTLLCSVNEFGAQNAVAQSWFYSSPPAGFQEYERNQDDHSYGTRSVTPGLRDYPVNERKYDYGYSTTYQGALEPASSHPISMPDVPEEIPLPGAVWVLLAGAGYGALRLRKENTISD